MRIPVNSAVRVSLALALAAFCSATAAPRVRADEFLLVSGARLRGQWLNQDEHPGGAYVMRTEQGVRVTLDARQVVGVSRTRPELQAYQQVAPQFGDTVAEQWKLAEWCRERGLDAHRRVHLQRITELDPQHVAAWHALGYSQVGGRWVAPHQVLQEQGYVYYRGRWRLAQEVELLEEDRRIELAAKRWLIDIKRWRKQLDGEKGQQALANMMAIRDPLAISALTYMLQRDTHRPLRLLYVEVLGKIDDHRATRVLVAMSLADHDVEVFHACLQQIMARKTPDIVKVFARALKDNNNQRVNRAAVALGKLGDASVIIPLIDALVTRHQITPPRACGATTTGLVYGPSDDLGTAFLRQGAPSTGDTVYVPNHDVLDALVRLSGGVSFAFDQQAWRNWHALQNSGQAASNSLRN